MTYNLPIMTYSDPQKQILRLLIEKSYLQSELSSLIYVKSKPISKANLAYHLSILQNKGLIKKKTVVKVGYVEKKEILINPTALQRIRNILEIKHNSFTLITGFGVIKDGYRIPDISYSLLKKYHYNIKRIICFTSPEARKKREEFSKAENLIKIDKYYDHYTYIDDYCNVDSKVFQDFEEVLCNELKTNIKNDIILDLTPQSKLFSFKLLYLANKYNLPCFLLVSNNRGERQLNIMSSVEIKGEMFSL